MNQDRWRAINEIFHAALELSQSERQEFVSKASGGDISLAEEVNHLLKADANAGSYIESPLLESSFFRMALTSLTPVLSSGDLLCSRFRILRVVGEGGMGHIFEALDEELGVHVALKVIRPEIASNPEALARFRQEVRLARRITHPNVCRTFDLERDTRVIDHDRNITTETIFLTMEFLEGETLAERIARDGQLPLNLALELAHQIAEALKAAQTLGVIHRDIKPANIMLVPSVSNTYGIRAVITDFGLARTENIDPLRSISDISNKATPIGTLAYMAPEQLSGAPVTPSTDIYAFGLVLFEMVTGKRAFPSTALLSGITQRLGGPPPKPSEYVPNLPDCWLRAIESCLQVKPEERVLAAIDAIAILDGHSVESAAHRPGLLSAIHMRFTWRHAIAGLFILLCASVSLFWAGLRFSLLRADTAVMPGDLVYLPPVKNETGEMAFDNLTELIRASLAQSAHINLLDQTRIGDTLQRMNKPPDTVIDEPIAREIAMRNGAVRVVFTRVTGAVGKYQLNVEIQQPDNLPSHFRDHWPKSFAWQNLAVNGNINAIPPDLLTAVRKASAWIRHQVGESQTDIAKMDAPPEDVTTDRWDALSAYTNAEALYMRHKTEDALTLLQNAVQIDPEFALAYARIGDLSVSLGKTAEGYHAYELALGTAFERRLTRRELDRIRGIYASDTWDYQAADAAFHDYTVFYEYDYVGWFFRALPLIRLGRLQEAVATLVRAYTLDPSRASAPYDLAVCFMQLNDFASAQHWIEVLKNQHQWEAAAQLEGIEAALHGNASAAQEKFSSMKASSTALFRLRSYLFQARIAAERGDTGAAFSYVNAGIAEAEADGNDAQKAAFLMDRASLNCQEGNVSTCLEDAQQSVGLDRSPELAIFATDIFGQAILTTTPGTKRALREALKNLSKILPANPQNTAYTLASLRIQIEELILEGRLQEALVVARRTAVIDMQFRRRVYLARALEIAAHAASHPDLKFNLLRQARDAYAASALHPDVIWIQPALYLPGALAADRSSFLRLSKQIGMKVEEQQTRILQSEMQPSQSR